MVQALVTTDKKRISLYVEGKVKAKLEKMAKARKRSLSNMIEIMCEEAADKSIQEGEIIWSDEEFNDRDV